MRKSAFLLILSFVLLGFFSCDFAVPKAIEIIGTPSIRFAETVDVGKMFTDLLTEAINKDDRLTIIPCSKTDVVTCLIHADLLNKEFDDLDDVSDFYEIFPHSEDDQLANDIDTGIPLDSDKILFIFDAEKEAPENRLIVPLSEIGSLLNGFELSDCEIKLYFSGSPIVEKSKIIITIGKFDDDDNYTVIDTCTKEKEDIDIGKSNIDEWKEKGYDKDSCPGGGIPIDIPITGEDIAFSFTILISDGEELKLEDFKDCKINVEVVVWLPFIFEAVDDNAELSFPEGAFFDSEDDLFGRDEPDDESMMTKIVESLSVNIKFQNSPFNGADFVIDSKGIEIHNRIANNMISFTITEDDMKLINDSENWPFTPNLKIRFQKDKKLSFPRIFNITEFGFKAKIRYRIDL